MSAVDVLVVVDSLRSVMYGPLIDGKPGTDSPLDAQAVEARAAVAELIEAAERADKLLHLLTVRQVIEAGYDAIDASGLNPYCMNEGLAEGHESIAPWWLASAIRRCKGEQA